MNNYEITCIDYLNVILNNVTVSLIQLLPKIWSLSYANELCYISTYLLNVSKNKFTHSSTALYPLELYFIFCYFTD